MQQDARVPGIEYACSEDIRDVIASLGRTEDVRFSPTGRLLAVASFIKNNITVFGTSIARSEGTKKIILTDVTQISSKYLNGPHGIDFIDVDKIIVANREGYACIFDLPKTTGNHELEPAVIIRSRDVATPGSVAVIKEDDTYEALICNNYGHSVTRHRLDLNARYSTHTEVLLKKGLEVPDGICFSRKKEWVALSSHNTHAVLLYRNDSSLNELSEPDGILRGNFCPHGLRFATDDRFILVADAAAPYVNIYQNDGLDWGGVHYPLLSFPVLSNEDFLRGRSNPEEGGPKGVDIEHSTNVIATTCEMQPLAFFDLDAILGSACEAKSVPESNYSLSKDWRRKQKFLEVNYELELQNLDQQSKTTNPKVWEMMNSRSWRITAPLRWMTAKLRGLRASGSYLAGPRVMTLLDQRKKEKSVPIAE